MNLDAEQQLVQRFYQHAVAGRARSDAEELQFAREMLKAAERGGVPADDGTTLWTVTDLLGLPVNADFLIEGETPQRNIRQFLPAIAVIVFGFLFVLLTNGGGGKTEVTPTPVVTSETIVLATRTLTPAPMTPSVTPLPTETSRPTNTPTITPTPLPTMTATPVQPKEIEIKPEPVELEPNAVIPVSIEIAGRYFPIVPTTLRDDPSLHSGQATWAYVTEPDRVSWLAGSRVNVVLGLPYSAANHDLLGVTLKLSDTFTVRDSVGGTQIYQVVERNDVSVYETEALRQCQVGLTLLLLGGNEEAPDRRLVIQALPVDRKEVATTGN